MVISDNDLQPEKHLFPIEITDDGMMICDNDLQPEKQSSPIEVTDDGIVNWVSDSQ